MDIQILSNILKFMERVTVSGQEAYAWVEAHQYIQSQVSKLAQEKLTDYGKDSAES